MLLRQTITTFIAGYCGRSIEVAYQPDISDCRKLKATADIIVNWTNKLNHSHHHAEPPLSLKAQTTTRPDDYPCTQLHEEPE